MESSLDLIAIELFDNALGPLLKVLQIVRRPPVFQISLCVKFSSLIVEAMGHLVSDNCAHSAVVNCVVSIRKEERRLEYACRKDYLVRKRIVICVHSRRCYAPLSQVGRLADLVQISAKGKLIGLEDV